jgi:uncharacterized paraquat-inducible protein A
MADIMYKGEKVEVIKLKEGFFAGAFQVCAGDRTSRFFETSEKAHAAINDVIKDWSKWDEKEKSPAVTNGIKDGKILYTCHECGSSYKARWASKWSKKPECPCCGEDEMISY